MANNEFFISFFLFSFRFVKQSSTISKRWLSAIFHEKWQQVVKLINKVVVCGKLW